MIVLDRESEENEVTKKEVADAKEVATKEPKTEAIDGVLETNAIENPKGLIANPKE